MERWRVLHKTSDYTVIDNGIFRDVDLSSAERGFLCTILSLPEDWDFSIKGLGNILHESTPTIRKVIRLLMDHGYCKLDRIVDDKTGRVKKWEYTFFEVKNGLGCGSEPQTNLPHVESPQSGVTTSGNFSTIKYLIESSTNKSSTDKKKESKDSKERFDFVSSLLSIGVSKDAAEQWLQVRKTKRATNTEIAFNRLKAEIDKSGHPADECIRFAVENSYSGFKAEWMPKEQTAHYVSDIEEYIRLNKHKYE